MANRQVEHTVGVAGDDANPFTPRGGPLPMPPLQSFRRGERFREANGALPIQISRPTLTILAVCLRAAERLVRRVTGH